MASKGDGNGRVTMALIGQKLDNLTTLVQEMRTSINSQSQQIGALQREDIALHGRIDRTNDRINALSLGQGAFAMLLSALAAWLGVRH